ncbi:hypothetical protein Aperf_G00000098478 [Anoplocephala perfoliata]
MFKEKDVFAFDQETMEKISRVIREIVIQGLLRDEQHGIPVFDDNQVVVVSGETGSGKTTQLPQYLLEHTILRGDGSRTRIVVTQPRRISAISVAERVARERGQEVSEDVGYQSVSHIFVDEVHEREMLGNILMTMPKRILPQRPDLHVIVMSATFNSDKFAEFFGDCPHLEIPGRTFLVESLFLEDVLRETSYGMSAEGLKQFKFMPLEADISAHENIKQDFKERVEDCPGLSENSRKFLEALGIDHRPPPKFIATFVNHIAQTCEPGAILVFIPGIADMQSVVKELKSLDPEFYVTDPEAGAVVYFLHSSLTTRPNARYSAQRLRENGRLPSLPTLLRPGG